MQQQLQLQRARRALLGIALGDAFGESFFGEDTAVRDAIARRVVPESSWEFTDDTVMALAVFEELELDGRIDQDRLAAKFARNYLLDMRRGYGGTAHRILREIGEGQAWQTVAANAFDGMGSLGNGASMRVAPIGAYLAGMGALADVAEMATLSAAVTHAHEEGIAGAVAVATAAYLAMEAGLNGLRPEPQAFLRQVAAATPDGETRSRIARAIDLAPGTHPDTLITLLGNGSKITAPDTVPFALWCAAHHLADFEAALWEAVSLLGDRDTICAIVGGIVILSCQPSSVPMDWMARLESIDASIFRTHSP